jgi:hypothetical protein
VRVDKRLILTVVIRGPAYAELLDQLCAIPDPRDRAGQLKRLAEDGAHIVGLSAHGGSRRAGARDDISSPSRSLDIRVAILHDEFPLLHAALQQCASPRARAALFRHLAFEAAVRRHAVPERRVAQGPPTTTTRSVGQESARNSLTQLDARDIYIPANFLAGFSGG